MEGLRHSMTHPRYLHSNSTSHNWPFSAIAELIDNAVDAGARRFDIARERSPEHGDMLVFQDDGHGLGPKDMLRMMSFGHCNKKDMIGHYGNGFKSGSMRLGTEAFVLSRDRKTGACCVGLLSQTFLKDINADEVLVPMLDARQPFGFRSGADMEHLLKYGPFSSAASLAAEFQKLPSSGTRIIIYSYRLPRRPAEFDFDTDELDVRVRSGRSS